MEYLESLNEPQKEGVVNTAGLAKVAAVVEIIYVSELKLIGLPIKVN